MKKSEIVAVYYNLLADIRKAEEEAKDHYMAGYEDGTKARDGERGSIYYGGYGDGFKDGYEKGSRHGEELRANEADCAYQCGLKRAWAAARNIYDIQNAAMVKELFGADANYAIHNFTASEAIEKIEAWEKQEQIEKSCSTCANLSEENEYTDFCWDECDNKSEWTPKQDALDIHFGSIENRDKIVKAVAGLLAAYGEQFWDVVADMQKKP
jgi:hypothetical protein